MRRTHLVVKRGAAEDVRRNTRLRKRVDKRRPGKAARAEGALEQWNEDKLFTRIVRYEHDFVDAARLPNPIDPPTPLMEARRRPRQLEVHDEAAGVLQVEALGRRISSNEKPAT